LGGFDVGEIPDDMMRTNSELDTDPMWQFGEEEDEEEEERSGCQ